MTGPGINGVRARRDDAAALASRSLVRLARGQFDLAVADAGAALNTGDRPFWALEAEGLAERKTGRDVLAKADLDTAATVDAKAAERARSLGL